MGQYALDGDGVAGEPVDGRVTGVSEGSEERVAAGDGQITGHIVGCEGVGRTVPMADRPVLFCVFAAIAALGVVSASVRVRRMWRAHRRRTLPGWTRFLGGLLALYGLYVVYGVVDIVVR
ncbi:hypothetical protein ACIOEX_06470 [Streptomyces sp. NPDC087850]|uniref:hypothetical protein n=1 Tax=Streptomyces sp. NPDC087850 TaxID=3365809 RepID=UPI003820831B